MAELVFGKDEGSAPVKPGQSGVKDLAAGHATAEQAAAAINRALSMA